MKSSKWAVIKLSRVGSREIGSTDMLSITHFPVCASPSLYSFCSHHFDTQTHTFRNAQQSILKQMTFLLTLSIDRAFLNNVCVPARHRVALARVNHFISVFASFRGWHGYKKNQQYFSLSNTSRQLKGWLGRRRGGDCGLVPSTHVPYTHCPLWFNCKTHQTMIFFFLPLFYIQ